MQHAVAENVVEGLALEPHLEHVHLGEVGVFQVKPVLEGLTLFEGRERKVDSRHLPGAQGQEDSHIPRSTTRIEHLSPEWDLIIQHVGVQPPSGLRCEIHGALEFLVTRKRPFFVKGSYPSRDLASISHRVQLLRHLCKELTVEGNILLKLGHVAV